MRHKQPQKSAFTASAGGMGTAVGIAVAFVLSPQLFMLGAAWVGDYTETYYFADGSDLARLLYLGFIAFFLFHAAKLICISLISSLGLWLGSLALSHSRKDLP